jgi:pilus assembly protein CpaC
MTRLAHFRSLRLSGAAAVALAASLGTLCIPYSAADAQVTNERPTSEIELSEGRAQIVNLPVAISDVVVSNDKVVSVQVKSPRQIVLFGVSGGEASVFATSKDGRVVYSTNVRVAQNINSVDEMLRTAMPEAAIKTTSMNGMILLTGTVATPEDSAEAERLVKAFMGDDTNVISRLKTATPLQVQLVVKISEVNRDFMKKVGVNLASRDTSGGFLFGIGQGRNVGTIASAVNPNNFPLLDASAQYGLPAGSLSLPFNPATRQFVTSPTTLFNFTNPAGSTAINLAGKLLGLDLASAIDLAETDGLATTLAQPTLTAISGETASFLAGGEIPFAVPQSLGQTTIEYKPYGISLSFSPVVLSDGRISIRVKPEVSQIAGNVSIAGTVLPSLTTRRVETTVELGSGQSFVIGGLLSNTQSNVIEKTPGVGNVPILGALFRSSNFRRNETELVIVVTPYLVKPVSANDIALPTDGYQAASDLERIGLGRTEGGGSGGDRPKPSMGDPVTIPLPGVGEPVAPAQAPAQQPRNSRKRAQTQSDPAAAPGFGF